MIASCIRYWMVSSETVSGHRSAIFCSKVLPNPPRSASTHLMVGGSCWWSPARMTRSAFPIAIQQAASRAWAASSMKRVVKWWLVNTR